MNLKSLIHILISCGGNKILWATNEELLSKIRKIHSDFKGSSDALNSPEIICDSILQMSDKISLYERGKINEAFTIELTKDELYRLFSLEYWREKQLDKLI